MKASQGSFLLAGVFAIASHTAPVDWVAFIWGVGAALWALQGVVQTVLEMRGTES